MAKNTFKNLSDEYREELIQKALKRFVQSEYEDIKIQDLAKAMDLPIGTFYSYFEDKKDLFIAILRSQHEKDLRHVAGSRPEFDENFQLKEGDYERSQDEQDFADYVLRQAPTAVLNDFFNGEYLDMISLSFKDALIQKMLAGEFRKDLDIDLVMHIYASLPIAVIAYCRSKNIYDRSVFLAIRNKAGTEYYRTMLLAPEYRRKNSRKKQNRK